MFRQYTTGSVGYDSALISPELFGGSYRLKIMDLDGDGSENLTPGYVIYEDGAPTRVLLIKFLDDGVKYFEAPSLSFKGNLIRVGQTLGIHFESDGRLRGQEVTYIINCDTANTLDPSISRIPRSHLPLRRSPPRLFSLLHGAS